MIKNKSDAKKASKARMNKSANKSVNARDTTKTWAIYLAIFCGFLGAIAQLLLKMGSGKINDSFTSIINWPLFFGLIFYGIATVLFLIALKHGEVTILYPLIATSYVWVSIFSLYFLGENITAAKWLGNFSIILGVSLIGYSARMGKGGKRR